jgi:hypothetical protein
MVAPIICVGDVHGRFDDLITILRQRDIQHAQLVQVGDFGLGFQSIERDWADLARLDRVLQLRDCHLFVIRGNHDCPRFFTETEEGPPSPRPSPQSQHSQGKPEAVRPVPRPRMRRSARRSSNRAEAAITLKRLHRLHLMPDYSLIELDGRKLLLVGGAISPDRKDPARQVGRSWWPDEGFRLEKARLAELDLSRLWAVVTHSAPADAPPPIASSYVLSVFAEVFGDSDLQRDVQAEREGLAEMGRLVVDHAGAPPAYWIYGHFHHHYSARVDGTTYVGLAELEMFPFPTDLPQQPSLFTDF